MDACLADEKLSYSIAELARATGIGRTTIYEEIKDGNLQVRKIRGRTIVLRSAALAWLNGHTASLPPPGSPAPEAPYET